MPVKSEDPKVEVRRDTGDGFIHFGLVSDGAFHPFYSERSGDYDERVQAAKDAEA